MIHHQKWFKHVGFSMKHRNFTNKNWVCIISNMVNHRNFGNEQVVKHDDLTGKICREWKFHHQKCSTCFIVHWLHLSHISQPLFMFVRHYLFQQSRSWLSCHSSGPWSDRSCLQHVSTVMARNPSYKYWQNPIFIFIYSIWVNYNDLTVLPNPGIMVSKEHNPQMAELFRLVTYDNLPS